MHCLRFNADFGYLEGVVRGLKSFMFTNRDYGNLILGETLEGFLFIIKDVKLNLMASDYVNYVSNIPSPVNVSMIEEKLQEKLVKEFNYFRSNAYEPLSTFLDYMTYGYMIDNVCLLIIGTLHNRQIPELLPRCHPLGMFDQIPTIGIVSTPSELYNIILIDTPLAKFFCSCLSNEQFDETHVEFIRSFVYKEYLESFYELCRSIGGLTFEIMKPILEFEADRRCFSIIINSLGGCQNSSDRLKLFPTCGKLYPDGHTKLSNVENFDQFKSIINYYPEYEQLFFENSTVYTGKTIEDRFYEHEVGLNLKSFYHQFNFAIFYSYIRLSEQQNRNITWISECISQKNKRQIEEYINIF